MHQARRRGQEHRGPRQRRGDRGIQHQQRGGQEKGRDDSSGRGPRARHALASKERVETKPGDDRLQDQEPPDRQLTRKRGEHGHRHDGHPARLRIGGEGDAAHDVGIPRWDVTGSEASTKEAAGRPPEGEQIGMLQGDQPAEGEPPQHHEDAGHDEHRACQ